jgi:hypothetical protein
MREEVTAHRLAAYSDAVFAVIVTIMVLELRAPDQPAFSALWPLWPTAIITGESVSATRFHMFLARWQRALRSSIKLCLKSYSYPTSEPLRLPYQRVSSPHPYEQGFLIQMNAVETRGVRRAVYSFLTVWSSVAREMRKNRRLRCSYISPKESV